MPSFRPYGPAAWLVDDVADPAAWAAGLDEADLPGVEDIVPAEVSVVVLTRRADHATVGRHLTEVLPRPRRDGDATVVIDVVYDGEDLADVAAACGVSVRDVVSFHTGAEFGVAFCGFSPGFAYLRGLPPVLHLPRRTRPRTRVPAGSVAIAAGYSAVYPSASPGGWHLLGRTGTAVWDVHAHPPTILHPGTRVRFRDIGRATADGR